MMMKVICKENKEVGLAGEKIQNIMKDPEQFPMRQIIPGVFELSRNPQKPKQAAATTTVQGKKHKQTSKNTAKESKSKHF